MNDDRTPLAELRRNFFAALITLGFIFAGTMVVATIIK
jgi:hypothetical protein